MIRFAAILWAFSACTAFSADWHADIRPTEYAKSAACETRDYDRKCYSHWLTIYGQDARQFVLSRDSLVSVTYNHRGRVVSGLWADPFTGFISRDPIMFDIDHLISLNEVDRRGGARMTPMQRALVANDPDNLLTVYRSANRFKGAKSLIQYLPADLSFVTEYARLRQVIADRYGLAPDHCESLALDYFEGFGEHVKNGLNLLKIRDWIADNRAMFTHPCFQ